MTPGCWVGERLRRLPGAGECDGALIRAHLIPKQRIRDKMGRAKSLNVQEKATLHKIVWDPRVWVPMCGGPTGIGGHHGQLDYGGVNRLVIPRRLLPPELEEFARVHGLEWSLDNDYGAREDV